MNHTTVLTGDRKDDRIRFAWSHPIPAPVRPSLSLPIMGSYSNLPKCGTPLSGATLIKISGLKSRR
jgi:hypothetical protein